MIKGAGLQRMEGGGSKWVTMPLFGQNQLESEKKNYIKEIKFVWDFKLWDKKRWCQEYCEAHNMGVLASSSARLMVLQFLS